MGDEQERGVLSRQLVELLEIQEGEQQSLAAEIHDGLIQDVVAAKMILDTLADESSEDAAQRATLTSAQEMLEKAIVAVRQLIGRLRPLVADHQSIESAIAELVRHHHELGGAHVEFTHHVTVRQPFLLECTLHRIAQEALANIRLHSNATAAQILMDQSAAGTHLEIEDQGVGFDPQQVSADHLGLRGIMQRAKIFGGAANIHSSHGEGTRIVVEMPLVSA